MFIFHKQLDVCKYIPNFEFRSRRYRSVSISAIAQNIPMKFCTNCTGKA